MSSLKTPICQMPGTYSVSLYMPGLPLRPLRGHSLGTQMTAAAPSPRAPPRACLRDTQPPPPAEVNRTRPPADRPKSSIRRWPRRPPRRLARGPGPHHRTHHGLSPRLRPPNCGRCTSLRIPQQAVLNVHTLEIANGSDYCSHFCYDSS